MCSAPRTRTPPAGDWRAHTVVYMCACRCCGIVVVVNVPYYPVPRPGSRTIGIVRLPGTTIPVSEQLSKKRLFSDFTECHSNPAKGLLKKDTLEDIGRLRNGHGNSWTITSRSSLYNHVDLLYKLQSTFF